MTMRRIKLTHTFFCAWPSIESFVKVSTNNGSFTADVVLVAVPLGVLKANDITFSPPLPEQKQLAIERLGFGTMFKIFLYFKECFWPRDKHFINFLPTETVVTSKPDPKLAGHLNSKQLEALTRICVTWPTTVRLSRSTMPRRWSGMRPTGVLS